MEWLYNLLSGLGYSVAYGHFAKSKDPPFITYQFNSSNDVYLDNSNAVKNGVWQVELYTDEKSPSIEEALENAFKANSLTYTKYEAWVDEEKLWQELYLIEILEDE